MTQLIAPGIHIPSTFSRTGGWLDDPIRKSFPNIPEQMHDYGHQGNEELSFTLFSDGSPIGLILISTFEEAIISYSKGINKYKNRNEDSRKYNQIMCSICCQYQRIEMELKMKNITKIAHISYILVLNKHRNKGLGKFLMNLAFSSLKQQGHQAVVFSIVMPKDKTYKSLDNLNKIIEVIQEDMRIIYFVHYL